MNISLKLKIDDVVPHIKLPSTRGVDFDSWDYKQRENLVIIFYHGTECDTCKKRLEEYSKAYEKADDFRYLAEFAAISYDTIGELKRFLEKAAINFPLLSDVDKTMSNKFTYEDLSRKAPYPSIFITDKFGALMFQKIVEKADQLPSGKEVLDWSFGINLECPECSPL